MYKNLSKVFPSYIYVMALMLSLNLRYYFILKGVYAYDEKIYYVVFAPLVETFLLYGLISLVKNSSIFRLINKTILVLTTLIYFIESYLLDCYSSLFSFNVAVAVRGSNIQELREFLGLVSDWDFTYSLGIWLLALLLSFISLKLIPILFSKLTKYLRLSTLITKGLILGSFLVFLLWLFVRYWYAFKTSYPPHRMNAVERMITNLRTSSECANLALNYDRNIDVNSPKYGAIKLDSQFTPFHFVLIIGETTRADYMHCYGYPLENTPHIDSLVDAGSLILFNDVVSSSPYTSVAVPNMLCLNTYENKKEWQESLSLPKMMQALGFQSRWISNQVQLGFAVQPIYALSSAMDSCVYSQGYAYDEAVLPLVNQWLEEEQEGVNSFDVIHLMGSHYRYSARYPNSFEKFTKEDLQNQDLEPRQKQNLVEFSNSIYYNDYVINEIIELYKDRRVIILYLSDHGEALYDDPQNLNLCGHSLSVGGLSVPMMIYLSPSLKSLDPNIEERIREASNRPFMTDILPHTIMGLLSIKADFYDASLDLFSPSYNKGRERIARANGFSLRIKKSAVRLSHQN